MTGWRGIGVVRWIVALASTWRGRFIAVAILTQLVLPLHYYVARRDHHDERFAWRMYSAMRMVRCDPRFTVDDRPVVLGTRFHETWVGLAQRGRYAVIEKMAAALCSARPGVVVKMAMTCAYLDGSTEHVGGYDMCRVPQL